jgi:hypothetical protein
MLGEQLKADVCLVCVGGLHSDTAVADELVAGLDDYDKLELGAGMLLSLAFQIV